MTDAQDGRLRAELSPEYLDELEEVFLSGLTSEGAARAALLDARCAGRPGLRADVESLLAAHDSAGAFITPHTLDGAGAALDPDSPEELAGGRIGAYRLGGRIARGGMGEVYRAERIEGGFTQDVAVKLIAARLLDPETVRRFQAEQQILASLRHPGIVSLLDGGITPEGRPYIVMEYVDGLSIMEFCRTRALPVRARLHLFEQVCAAVAFAHRHLVVHRDLKPANVLVTTDGLVKVLDFGVAKLLEPQPAGHGATIPVFGLLTPDYASPEQIKGLPTTTACDVYALGVLLYEMLSGARPYDTTGRTLDEVVAVVVDQEVRRPSAGEAAGLPYACRDLRGDLDAIVLKAMAKTVESRYASVEQLGADVARFLEGRPVEARPPSRAYLLRRMVARHRAAFAVAAVFLVLLSAAVAGVLWQARAASRERERALQRFSDVRELASALVFRIHDEVAPLAGSTPVRETILAEGLKFLERLEGDAASDPALRLELARAYVRMGDVQGRSSAANLGNKPQAIRSYQRARDMAAGLVDADPSSWPAFAALTEANLRLASELRGDEANAAARAAVAAASEWQQREPRNPSATVLLARAHFSMALREAEAARLPHWLEANRLFGEVLAEAPDDLNSIRNVALTEKYLGAYFDRAREFDKALEHYRRAHALDERRVRARPDDRQALIDLAIDIGAIAGALANRNRTSDAIAAYKQSLAIRERLAVSDPKDVYARGRVAFVQGQLAGLYILTGDLAVARQHAAAAAALAEPLIGVDDEYRAQYAMAVQRLGDVDWRAGKRREACRLYRRAVTHYRRVGTDHIYSDRSANPSTGEQALARCEAARSEP